MFCSIGVHISSKRRPHRTTGPKARVHQKERKCRHNKRDAEDWHYDVDGKEDAHDDVDTDKEGRKADYGHLDAPKFYLRVKLC